MSIRRSAPDITLANTGAATVPPWARRADLVHIPARLVDHHHRGQFRVRRRHQAGKYRHDPVGGIAARDGFERGAGLAGYPIADERGAGRGAALFDHLLHQLHQLVRDLGIEDLLAGHRCR